MTTTTAAPATARAVHPLLLTALLTAQFMALLDTSVVNVAGPTIRTDLDTSGAGLQLVISGYTIVYAMLIVTGSRLGGRLGFRRVFNAGLIVFTLASLLCGLAWDDASLIGARAVQGAGAALMVPQVLNLIQATYTGVDRARAMGRYAAVIAGGMVAGQVVGGLLVSADLFGLSWRPVFLINIPVGIALYVLARRALPAGGTSSARGLDGPGLALLAPALLALVVPLVMGHELDWPTWGWLSLAACVVLFVAFAAVERRAPAPLIPVSLLRVPGVLAGAITLLLVMTAFGGLMFATALYVQNGLGYSALEAGLTFIPSSVVFAGVSLRWQLLPAAWHPRLPMIGMPIGAVGFALSAWAFGTGQPLAVLLAVMVVGSFGLGVAYSPVMMLSLRRVPLPQAPDASGLMVTMIQLGQVLGVAAFGTLYLSIGTDFHHAGEVTATAIAATVLLTTAPAARLSRG
ncbi:MFS transporter [Embleya sp. NBC_00896]|uniref:MFS transporter n=1 Tax=Embleya sp. NBC_00896 TaxID=2975961 RepID=UPI003866C320|nr:MFS transporter [Embleya sp. NBC_00896]